MNNTTNQPTQITLSFTPTMCIECIRKNEEITDLRNECTRKHIENSMLRDELITRGNVIEKLNEQINLEKITIAQLQEINRKLTEENHILRERIKELNMRLDDLEKINRIKQCSRYRIILQDINKFYYDNGDDRLRPFSNILRNNRNVRNNICHFLSNDYDANELSARLTFLKTKLIDIPNYVLQKIGIAMSDIYKTIDNNDELTDEQIEEYEDLWLSM